MKCALLLLALSFTECSSAAVGPYKWIKEITAALSFAVDTFWMAHFDFKRQLEICNLIPSALSFLMANNRLYVIWLLQQKLEHKLLNNLYVCVCVC